jgi:ABC-type dipeptide/oligopeptide/nickel transport system permease component
VILVLAGISVPSFVVAGLLQFFFDVYLKILPVARYESFRHILMPAFALSLGTMATLSRYVLAMQNLDYTLVMGLTLFVGFFLIAMNWLVDFAYGIIDPRVRHMRK